MLFRWLLWTTSLTLTLLVAFPSSDLWRKKKKKERICFLLASRFVDSQTRKKNRCSNRLFMRQSLLTAISTIIRVSFFLPCLLILFFFSLFSWLLGVFSSSRTTRYRDSCLCCASVPTSSCTLRCNFFCSTSCCCSCVCSSRTASSARTSHCCYASWHSSSSSWISIRSRRRSSRASSSPSSSGFPQRTSETSWLLWPRLWRRWSLWFSSYALPLLSCFQFPSSLFWYCSYLQYFFSVLADHRDERGSRRLGREPDRHRRGHSPDVGETFDRVFVRGYGPRVDHDAIAKHFSQWGRVVKVQMLPGSGERGTGDPFAFVQFASSREAQRAVDDATGSLLQGEVLTVRPKFSRKRGADVVAEREKPEKMKKTDGAAAPASDSSFSSSSFSVSSSSNSSSSLASSSDVATESTSASSLVPSFPSSSSSASFPPPPPIPSHSFSSPEVFSAAPSFSRRGRGGSVRAFPASRLLPNPF